MEEKKAIEEKKLSMEGLQDELFLVINKGKAYDKVIGDAEKMLIEKALKRSFGNQSIAAKLLGINRNTLRSKIQKYSIDITKFRI